MWKYIVTYFVIVVTPVLKETSGEPPNRKYIELVADTTTNTEYMDSRKRAIDYMKMNGKILSATDKRTVYLSGFKLDSIKIKKQ